MKGLYLMLAAATLAFGQSQAGSSQAATGDKMIWSATTGQECAVLSQTLGQPCMALVFVVIYDITFRGDQAYQISLSYQDDAGTHVAVKIVSVSWTGPSGLGLAAATFPGDFKIVGITADPLIRDLSQNEIIYGNGD